MKFKAKTRSDVTEELKLSGLCEGWTLRIRYISPAHERALRDDAVAKREDYLDLYTDAVLLGWEGCRPEMIQALAELDESGGDKLPVDEAGFVPHSKDLARFIMREAPSDAFYSPIYQMGATLLRRIALAKKNAHSGSES